MKKRRKEQINGTFNIECNRKSNVYIETYNDVTKQFTSTNSLFAKTACATSFNN